MVFIRSILRCLGFCHFWWWFEGKFCEKRFHIPSIHGKHFWTFCDANFLGQTNHRVVQHEFSVLIFLLTSLQRGKMETSIFITAPDFIYRSVYFLFFFSSLVRMKNKSFDLRKRLQNVNERVVFPHIFRSSACLFAGKHRYNIKGMVHKYKLNANPFFALPSQNAVNLFYFVSGTCILINRIFFLFLLLLLLLFPTLVQWCTQFAILWICWRWSFSIATFHREATIRKMKMLADDEIHQHFIQSHPFTQRLTFKSR